MKAVQESREAREKSHEKEPGEYREIKDAKETKEMTERLDGWTQGAPQMQGSANWQIENRIELDDLFQFIRDFGSVVGQDETKFIISLTEARFPAPI